MIQFALDNILLLLASVLVLIVSVYFLRKRASSKLPRGPFNPLGRMFGRTYTMAEANVLGLTKYGDVCCVHVIGTTCVYLNSYAKIRQFFITHGDALSGRLDMRGIQHPYLEGRGIVMNDGLSWTEHRRFVVSTLRDFGFGSGGAEQVIHTELKQLLDTFASYKGKPFDPFVALNTATCNVISMLAFGERSGNDQKFNELLKMTQKVGGDMNQLHDCVAALGLRVMARLPRYFLADIFNYLDEIYAYMRGKVEERKKRFNGEVHDLIDCYLKSLLDKDASSPHANSTFSEKELYVTLTDLFTAGMETTASTIRWAILLLIRNPDVQKRARQEIEQVLQGRYPTMADRKDLPYTDAVICEVQRFASITPLGVHRRCTETVSIGEHVIPKDCLVYPNIFAVHRDESVWPDAFHFNPLNFYDESKKALKNTEYLIPFSVGRRSCLGESLAKQELFIFITGLIQTFELLLCDAASIVTEESCSFGNFRILYPFEIVVKQ